MVLPRATLEQKIRMVQLRERGLSFPKIVNLIEKEDKDEKIKSLKNLNQLNPDIEKSIKGRRFNIKTVSFWVNEWYRRKRINRIIGKRRVKLISSKEEKRIVKFVNKNDTIKLRMIKRKFKLSCHISTISRILNKNGLSKYKINIIIFLILINFFPIFITRKLFGKSRSRY